MFASIEWLVYTIRYNKPTSKPIISAWFIIDQETIRLALRSASATEKEQSKIHRPD